MKRKFQIKVRNYNKKNLERSFNFFYFSDFYKIIFEKIPNLFEKNRIPKKIKLFRKDLNGYNFTR